MFQETLLYIRKGQKSRENKERFKVYLEEFYT